MTNTDVYDYVTKRQKEIGERVKKVRRRNRWSQSDLADFLGCSRARINRAESGTTPFNVGELEIIANQFQVTVFDLLGWKVQVEAPTESIPSVVL